jgi:hypothetical protein
MRAQHFPGCGGSGSLGTFRILVRRSSGGAALAIKSLSVVPPGSHLIWEPTHLPSVLLPNLVLSALPVRVNQGETVQPLRIQWNGLDRIEAVSSEAGEITGAFKGSDWSGAIRLKPGAPLGATFALRLKVKGLDALLTVPDAIKIFRPRPVITSLRKAIPCTLDLSLHPDELPAGIMAGLSLEVRQGNDSSVGDPEARPRVELGYKSRGLRKVVSLSADEHLSGAELTAAAPGMLFLTTDPAAVGNPRYLLTATVDMEPEGWSDAFLIGRVIRVPRLEQLTLTDEQINPSTYVGILKGRDLDVIGRTGWDARQGMPVESVPTPVLGQSFRRPSASHSAGTRPRFTHRSMFGSATAAKDKKYLSPTDRFAR